MSIAYDRQDMDPLILASRLPTLAERSLRAAVVSSLERSRMTPRSLINDALVRFERAIQAEAPDGVRPALLFAERDRIVRELRGFIDGRLAARLAALRHRDVVATGRDAWPFDLIVRNRRDRCYAIVLRRLPEDGRRLEVLHRIHRAAEDYKKTHLAGVFVYDFRSGSGRIVRRGQRVERAPQLAYARSVAV